MPLSAVAVSVGDGYGHCIDRKKRMAEEAERVSNRNRDDAQTHVYYIYEKRE